jgi:hypothetical protein
MRELLSPDGSRLIDNGALLNAMCDIVERDTSGRPTAAPPASLGPSMMRNSGIYTGDDSVDDSKLFVCEWHALTDLLEGLKIPCSCGMSSNPWTVDSAVQKGHVIRLAFSCRRCHQVKRTWSSSRVFAGHYLVNQKYA